MSTGNSPRSAIWDQDIKVLVCCVHYGAFDLVQHTESFSGFIFDAADLIRSGKVHVYRDRMQPLDYRRSWLAWTAALDSNGFTHMFMYDTDMEVRLDHLSKLLSREVACVSGTYYMGACKKRTNTDSGEPEELAFPCVSSIGGHYITRQKIENVRVYDTLIEVDGVGAGCLLVRTDLLRSIGCDPFRMNWRLSPGHAEIELEDGWFSRMARNTGEKLYIDPSVQPDHFKMMRIGYTIKDMNGNTIAQPDS